MSAVASVLEAFMPFWPSWRLPDLISGIDIRTGEIFPCNFMERDPEAQLRSARHFSDERHVSLFLYASFPFPLEEVFQLLNIYDHTKKRFVIDPFPFYPIGHAKAILNLPDEWILLVSVSCSLLVGKLV